jgi:hypothetical protein
MKYYVINTKLLTEEEVHLYIPDISDEMFIDIAKRSGDVYSEEGIKRCTDDDEFDHVNSHIRRID